jgi:hypothetical protein
VLAGRQLRLVPAFAGGLAAGTALLLAPFVVAAPATSWHDVVVTQFSRPTNTDVAHGLSRVASMVGMGWFPTAIGVVVVAVVLVLSGGAVRRDPGSPLTLWLALAVVSGAAILWAPTYFLHYGAFLGPAVILLAARVATTARCWGSTTVAVMGLAFVIGSGSGVVHARGRVDLGHVGALVPSGSCVYYDAVSLALAADVFRDPSSDCPSWVDGRGVALTENTGWPKGVDFYPAGFAADAAWQAANVAQMQHADFLLLRDSPATFPEWAEQTREYVLQHFTRTYAAGSGSRTVELWTRSRPG